MSTDVICRVQHGGLRAINEAESSKLDDLRGLQVMCRISQPRNLQFHRKGFALLHSIFELVDTELTFEQFRKLLVAKAGYGEFISVRGKVIFLPKSLSWGSMDETEFQKVYQDIITVAIREYAVDENSLSAMLEFA